MDKINLIMLFLIVLALAFLPLFTAVETGMESTNGYYEINTQYN